MDRQQHLDWCKQRAIEYVEQGDLNGAFASFQSDMRKHDETRDHLALEMMTMMVLGGNLQTPAQMRHFIEGFN